MSRIPTSPQGPTNTPDLSDSPQSYRSHDPLVHLVHAAIDDLSLATKRSEYHLPSDFVGKLTLKLLAVQRSFGGGGFNSDPLFVRQKLWNLQGALNAAPQPGLKDAAEAFNSFVMQQDSERVLALAEQFRSGLKASLSSPVVAEVQAIADHSPSTHAQAVARDLLSSPSSFDSGSLPPLSALSAVPQSTPVRALEPSPLHKSHLRRVSAHANLPPGAPPTQRLGAARTTTATTHQIKLFPEVYSRSSVKELQLPKNLKVRKIECAHEATYWRSHKRKQGTYGAFYRGIDQDGRRVGIKALRLVESPKGDFNVTKRTYRTAVTPKDVLAKEVALIRALGGRVKLHDMVLLEDKALLVMTDMAGGLDEALGKIGLGALSGVVRNVMAQCSRQLRGIHLEKEHAHLDLKLPNILLDHDGHVVPIDFGISLEIQSDLKAIDLAMGTYPSPEMAAGDHVGAAADVWALAIVFLMSNDMRFGRPFEYCLDFNEGVARAQNFINFYQRLRDPKTGRYDIARLNPLDGGYGMLFSRLYRRDPKATEFVLLRMLAPDPTLRATMDQVHTFFKDLVEADPEEAARSTKALSSAAQEIDDVATTEALLRVRDFDLADAAAKRDAQGVSSGL